MVSGGAQRIRLGLLVPSSNTTMEPDFHRHLPSHATLHTARMYLEDNTVAVEERMLDEFALPAARDLATTRPQAIVFGCTSGGALRGNAYDQKLCQDISHISGVPTVSTIASVRKAIKASGAKRIAIITPYIEDLAQRVRASIEADGIDVVSTHNMGLIENTEIGRMTPQEIVAFAEEKVRDTKADLLFASCTNWRAMEAIPMLKQLFNIPVISSNQVVLEAALQTLGVAI